MRRGRARIQVNARIAQAAVDLHGFIRRRDSPFLPHKVLRVKNTGRRAARPYLASTRHCAYRVACTSDASTGKGNYGSKGRSPQRTKRAQRQEMSASGKPLTNKHGSLHLQQFAEAFGLRAADRDLGAALIGHFKHVARLEPRHDFLDVVDVDQVGAVRAPEDFGLERRL